MEQRFLEKVYGYSSIKDELKIIYDWYSNKEFNKTKSNLLPKGILFYGEPGEGKTHLVREYSKTFNYPIFVIEGNEENVEDEIVKVYAKAKMENRAIVIIDELDKLIGDDKKLTRILMTQLDGFNHAQNILTLATANNFYGLPEALLREGRFDRKFKVKSINKKEIMEMIEGFSKDSGINLSEDDIYELSDEFSYLTSSAIKSIFNNVSLRYGENPSYKDIINVSDYLNTGILQKDDDFKVMKHVAIHEAGHAIYSYKYAPSKKFLRIYFDNEGGKTVSKDKDFILTSEALIDNVKVAFGGLVAEELILGKHNIGSDKDLEKAYRLSFYLVNRSCVFGINSYCDKITYSFDRNASDKSKNEYEKKTLKFMKKCYKEVKKCLRKEKYLINKVADYLLVHKEIKRNEFIDLISENEA